MADPPPAAKEIAFGQLGTLSTDARAVLEAASVLGTRAPTAPLTRITGLSAAGFASAVMELERRGMLRLSPRQDALDFPGEAARHQVYRLVAPDRRRTLHAAAARALAALPAGPADLETTAEHERLAIVPRPHHANRRLMLAISLVVLAAAVLTYLLT